MNLLIKRFTFGEILLTALMASPLLLYVTPVRGMAIYIYSLVLPFVAIIYLVKGVRVDCFYIPFLFAVFLFFLASSLFYFNGNLKSVLFALNLLLSSFMAFMLLFNPRVALTTAKIVLAFLFVWYFYCVIKFGHTPVDANSYLYQASRNHVSFLLLVALFFYYSTCIYHEKRFSLLPISLMVPISIQLYGRSGILISSALFFIVLCYKLFENKKREDLLWSGVAASFLFCIVLSLVVPYFYQENFGANNVLMISAFDRGISSPRWEMASEYIMNLNASTFFLGQDMSKIPLIEKYHGNPHNSFIVGHSNFGVFFLALVFGVVSAVGIRLFLRFSRKRLVLSLFFMLLIVRASVDSMFFYSAFDFIFIYMFLLLMIDGTRFFYSSKN